MFKEPLNVFTALADFGETVLIDGVAVNALFDREAVPDNIFGAGFANAAPLLVIADVHLPPDVMRATFTARGVEYVAGEVLPDGTGMTEIKLKVKHDESRAF